MVTLAVAVWTTWNHWKHWHSGGSFLNNIDTLAAAEWTPLKSWRHLWTTRMHWRQLAEQHWNSGGNFLNNIDALAADAWTIWIYWRQLPELEFLCGSCLNVISLAADAWATWKGWRQLSGQHGKVGAHRRTFISSFKTWLSETMLQVWQDGQTKDTRICETVRDEVGYLGAPTSKSHWANWSDFFRNLQTGFGFFYGLNLRLHI